MYTPTSPLRVWCDTSSSKSREVAPSSKLSNTCIILYFYNIGFFIHIKLKRWCDRWGIKLLRVQTNPFTCETRRVIWSSYSLCMQTMQQCSLVSHTMVAYWDSFTSLGLSCTHQRNTLARCCYWWVSFKLVS